MLWPRGLAVRAKIETISPEDYTMTRLLSIALICGLVWFVSTSFAKDKAETKNAEKIVGTWKLVKCEVMKEEVKTGEAEFLKDMSCKMSYTTKDGKEITKKGKYEFEGETKIKITVENPTKEEEKTKELTIDTLTDTKLVLVHPKGEKTEFERVTK